MRLLRREVAAVLCPGLQSGASAANPTTRALRHLTSIHASPALCTLCTQRRSFVTFNHLLSKGEKSDDVRDGSIPSPTVPAAAAAAAAAAASNPQPPQQPKSSKKKSNKALSNPLRRVVSIAQQPGRKPSQAGKDGEHDPEQADDDDTNKLRAICVAESFDMDIVVKILTQHWYQLDPDGLGFDTGDVVHARANGGDGDVFVFPSGTVVTWSLPADVGTTMATGILLRAAQNPNLESAEKESLDFETDGTMSMSTMRRDKVILGTKQPDDGDRTYPTLAKIAFSSGLARSAKIAFLEALLSAYFKKTKDIPMQLKMGRLSVNKKFILQRTGELLNLRSQLNLYSELTDSLPDMFWDQSWELRLENNYDQVGRALDVLDRIKLLNQRMDYAQEMATVMREMWDTAHGAFLEKIIIALIMIEVIFEIRRIFSEFKDSWQKEDQAIRDRAQH